MNENRVKWIDACKGLGIILVVLGHAPISRALADYIFSFHMPLFFFISGYLLNVNKEKKITEFMISKIKSLLVPYVSFSFISIILISLINDTVVNSWREFFRALIISKRNDIFYNIPLWFLTTLFLVEILYFIIKKYMKDNILIFSVLILLSAIGYIKFKTLQQPKLMWTFDSAIYYMIFFGVGNIIKDYNTNNKSILRQTIYSIAAVLNISLLVSPNKLGIIYRFTNQSMILGYFWSLIIAFAGIITCVYISKYIKESKIVSYLGNNTLIILGLHMPLAYVFINRFVGIYKIQIQPSNITGVIYTIIAFMILKPVIEIINNYFPCILGKYKKRCIITKLE